MTVRLASRLFGIGIGLIPLLSGTAAAGTVTGVKPGVSSIATGAALTVTVTGSNPCGAAFIDYGDGTAITYAITALPTSQSHTYRSPGAYRLIARGMGNCDGEAVSEVDVTGPALPAPAEPPAPAGPPKASISAVRFSQSPAHVRDAVAIAIDGQGTCAFVVEFGDGNKQSFTRPLPTTVTHAYGAADTYTVIVGPVAPCEGKFTQRLEVVPAGGPSITGLAITPLPAVIRQNVVIDVGGSGGTCSYTIDFGDGNREQRSRPLPDQTSHTYTAPDTYTIVVTAGRGCRGSARQALTVFGGLDL